MSEHRVSEATGDMSPLRAVSEASHQHAEPVRAISRRSPTMLAGSVQRASRQLARLVAWCRTREGKRFYALLAAAVTLRLVVAPVMVFSTDVSTYFY